MYIVIAGTCSRPFLLLLKFFYTPYRLYVIKTSKCVDNLLKKYVKCEEKFKVKCKRGKCRKFSNVCLIIRVDLQAYYVRIM